MGIGVNQPMSLPVGVIPLSLFSVQESLVSRMLVLEVPNRYEVPPAHIKLNSDHAETLPTHPTNGRL